jgi:hypothetical protein
MAFVPINSLLAGTDAAQVSRQLSYADIGMAVAFPVSC